MANATIEEKIPEAESPLKQEDGVTDSDKETEKKEAPVSDDKEKDEATDQNMEEKGQVDDGENQEENTGKEPVTPVGERPTRIRKKVEPYISPTLSRHSGSKPVSIEQGRGTRLKEIPNVAYKLSKRKPDDNLFLLHTILYGRKGKAQMLKRNIGQFSGFVWSEQEEEKQRAKAKEKLEKCIKEKLIDFCDVLDIPINKSNVKKEELAVRVLEFLVYPKATRDIVLADRQKETKKRKRTPKNVNSEESSDVSAKRRRQTKKSGKKLDQPSETEERNDEGDVGSEGTDDSHGEDDAALEKENDKNEDTETEDEKDKAEEKKSTDKKSTSKSTAKKEKQAPEEEKSVKGPAKSGRKSSKQVDKSTSSSSKKQEVDKDDSKGKKQTSKPQAKGSGDQEKASKKGKREPTRKEMHVVVAKILKEVDFNTATLSDILRKLGSHFGVDLMHRKTEVKDIITDAIDEMGDDDEREDEGEKKKEAEERKD